MSSECCKKDQLPIRIGHVKLIPVKQPQLVGVEARVEGWGPGPDNHPDEKLYNTTVAGDRTDITGQLRDVVVDFSTEGRLVILDELLREEFKRQTQSGDHSIIVLFGSHRGGHKGGN